MNRTALEVYRRAMPGYHVVGINCDSLISAGGIHCATHEIQQTSAIRISHPRFTSDLPFDASGGADVIVPFTAECWANVPLDGVGLHIQWPNKTTSVYPMYLASGVYTAQVPIPDNVGGEVRYYIRAQSTDGTVVGYKPVNGYDGGYLSAWIGDSRLENALTSAGPNEVVELGPGHYLIGSGGDFSTAGVTLACERSARCA